MLKPSIVWILVIVTLLFPPAALVTLPLLGLVILEVRRKRKIAHRYAVQQQHAAAYAYFAGGQR